MRKNFGAKPILYPLPVFILAAYDREGKPNCMNVAWGGVSESNQLSFCIGQNRRTLANILASGAFTVSMATEAAMAACDYVGLVSGNDTPDKMARAGFHTAKSEFVNAPLICELPMAVECRLIGYDSDACRLLGEIVNVSADESILDGEGRIDPAKLRPISFDAMNNAYLVLGEKVGDAFRVGLALK